MSGQLEIPGYTYDSAKKRYFKMTPEQMKAAKRTAKVEKQQAKRDGAAAASKGKLRENIREIEKPDLLERPRKRRPAHQTIEDHRLRSPVWSNYGSSRSVCA